MRLAIINITAGGMSRGYKKYLTNILPRLSANPIIEKIICALPSSVTLDIDPNIYPNIEFIAIAPYRLLDSKSYSELKKKLDMFQTDVVYVPVERSFSYENAPVVIMLQNMEPFVYPFSGLPVSEKLKNLIRYLNARKALKKADRIIAISKFVENYLVNQLDINSHKIGLVYHGIDKSKSNSKKPASIPENINDFLFTAGSIRPARGLEDIIQALAFLSTKDVKVPSLVIAGNTDAAMARYQNKINKMIYKYGLSQKVIWAGNLDESEMAWCYQNGSIFITTSRVEACPNIVLEAMSFGCVCISTDALPMTEFFKDTAIYYTEQEAIKLGQMIQKVLSWNISDNEKISERTRKRISEYSWDVCSERTVNELQIAVEDFKQRNNRK